MYDLHIDHLFYSGIHGGSMVMYCKKEKKSLIDIDSFIKGIEVDMNDIRTYQTFAWRVNAYREKLYDMILSINQKGYKIHGYGAPAKGNTLLNYVLGENTKLISEIEEANPLKINLYTPHTHIHICDYKNVTERPKYYLVLAWNFLQEFLQNEVTYLENDGNFIVPFPYEPFIINKNNYKKFL
jgi:hypothetical protein